MVILVAITLQEAQLYLAQQTMFNLMQLNQQQHKTLNSYKVLLMVTYPLKMALTNLQQTMVATKCSASVGTGTLFLLSQC
jgi:hypothetical protein